MAEKNPSFVLHEPYKVSYEDRPIPDLKNPRDVVVRINYTGICGSDIHYWDSGRIGDFIVKSPMILGHESAGTVSKVGSDVTSLVPGDRVALEPGVPCRHCFQCKSGHYNLCPEMEFASTPPHDGTLTKYYVLPEDFCYKLPEGMSLEEGALVEPTSVAVHIVKQGGIKTGDKVVVFGAGPVGLLCIAVSKAFGAQQVVAVDIVEERVKFAEKYAGVKSFAPGKVGAEENAKSLIDEHQLGVGADVVIDASGAEPSVQTGLLVVRNGGTYVQGGMGKPNITFPIMAACTKELTVKGSFRYGAGDYATAVGLIANGQIRVKELITGVVGFEEAEKAFKDVKAGKGIKTLIEGVKD